MLLIWCTCINIKLALLHKYSPACRALVDVCVSPIENICFNALLHNKVLELIGKVKAQTLILLQLSIIAKISKLGVC